MPEYTLLAVLSVVGTVAVEVFWLRTGLFRKGQYWIAMAIVYCFHVLVDGWLTKLSAPIVIYDEGQITGVRVPWDIPVEDYLFGFSMITVTLLLWVRQGDQDDRVDPLDTRATSSDPDTDSTDETGRLGRPTTQEAP
jgi:lycopene cyclase domain-containing protein